jgi:hypothetical protein
MKRLFFTICLVAVGLFFAQAQTKVDTEKMRKERMENMRTNLKLTTQEGKTFWSAYDQFLRNEIKLHETFKQNLAKQGIRLNEPGKNKEIIAKLSDKQLTYLQDQKFQLRKDVLNLEASFYKKIKSILTPRHIQDFYNIEEKYKRAMVNKKKVEAEKKAAVEPTSVNPGKKKR